MKTDQLQTYIKVRTTSLQRKDLEERVKENGYNSISSYLRDCIFSETKQKYSPRKKANNSDEVTTEIDKLRKEINKIGWNIMNENKQINALSKAGKIDTRIVVAKQQNIINHLKKCQDSITLTIGMLNKITLSKEEATSTH